MFDAGDFIDPVYKNASRNAGCDLFEYLLETTKSNGIDCYAWINCLIFSTRGHRLVKKHGKDIITRDQYGNYFDGVTRNPHLDKYYQRDPYGWLEPGDSRVQQYVLDIVKKIVKRYPQIKGVQLDYIRYPLQPPFIPGSWYMKWGVSTGYGKENVNRFHKTHGFYPTGPNIGSGYKSSSWYRSLLWDRWRRKQVTQIVKKAGEICRTYNKKLTATVFAYADRVYFHGFQNWRTWLHEDYLDTVILMNYSIDDEMVHHISRQHIMSYPGRVWIGIGAYVMRNNSGRLFRQLSDVKNLKAPGVVLFEYSYIRDISWIPSVVRKADIGE